jgi:hypothetical protein
MTSLYLSFTASSATVCEAGVLKLGRILLSVQPLSLFAEVPDLIRTLRRSLLFPSPPPPPYPTATSNRGRNQLLVHPSSPTIHNVSIWRERTSMLIMHRNTVFVYKNNSRMTLIQFPAWMNNMNWFKTVFRRGLDYSSEPSGRESQNIYNLVYINSGKFFPPHDLLPTPVGEKKWQSTGVLGQIISYGSLSLP